MIDFVRKNLTNINTELESGNIVYLYEQIEEAVIKITPNKKCYAKFSNSNEFELNMDTNLVTNALSECFSISKKQYDEF